MKLLIGLIVLVLVTILCYGGLVAFAQPAPSHPYFSQWRAERLPIVIADRGGNGLWPENTLYAFERAAAMGVDMLGMDVRSTADGVLVLMHDPVVDRTTDGVGPVTSITLEEIRVLDAGHTWSSDGAMTFPFRGQAVTVPTVEEVFAALPDFPMSVDIKQTEPRITTPLCALIREYGMTEKVLVSSFNSHTLDQFQRACPKVATFGSNEDVRTFTVLNFVFLGAIYQPGFHAIKVSEYWKGMHILTPLFLETAKGRNMHVYVQMIDVDIEVEIQRMLALGPDGIITSYPDRVIDLLGR